MPNPSIHQGGHEHAIGEDMCELLESHGVLWNGEYWTLGPGVIEPVDSFRVFSIACMAIMEELACLGLNPVLYCRHKEKYWYVDAKTGLISQWGESDLHFTPLAALLAARGGGKNE